LNSFDDELTTYKKYYDLNETQYFKFVQKEMKDECIKLYALQKELVKNTILLPDYNDYAQYSTERNMIVDIPVNDTYKVHEDLSLSESMMQFISAVFSTANEQQEFDIIKDGNMMYMVSNGLDVLIEGILNSADFYSLVFSYMCFTK